MGEWIEWSGGDQPVDDCVRVDVRHADGDETMDVYARDLIVEGDFNWWKHEDCLKHAKGGFVVAYRRRDAS